MTDQTTRLRKAGWALLTIGAWAGTAPYTDGLAGIALDVRGSVEVVDHVLPAAVLVMCAVLLVRASSWPVVSRERRVLAAVVFLAAFWMAATHAPLVGDTDAGAFAWHAGAAAAAAAVSLGVALSR